MRRGHRYELVNSPGRIPTIAGSLSLTAGIIATVVMQRTGALLGGFGAFDVLGPLTRGHGGWLSAAAVTILLGYPTLYAISLMGEATASHRALVWLGRRLRGSLCLLWTTLLAALLTLAAIEGAGHPVLLGLAAAFYAAGGLAARGLERQAHPSFKPLARVMPAALLSVASVGIAITTVVRVGDALGSLDGLMGSAVLVGSVLMFYGSARDVLHQLQTGPRRVFCRDAMSRALLRL